MSLTPVCCSVHNHAALCDGKDTAEAMAASLTLLPSFVKDQWRGLAVLGSFTGSLLLLLAACCLYTGGDWFFVAMAWILFGATHPHLGMDRLARLRLFK